MAKKDKYSAPGKGVKKNQAEKRAFFAFVELYFHKFWDLIKINMIMFVCFIPLISALTFPAMGGGFIVAMVLIQSVLLGPCLCGVSYLLRNITNKSHAWIWSDFKDVFIDNYKAGFVMGFVDILAIWLLYVANNYYTLVMGGTFGDIISAVIVVFFALFIMVNMYIYPMIVTFDNTISSHFKNAIVFTLANLPRSVLAFVIDILVILGLGYILFTKVPVIFAVIIMVVLLAFFVFSFLGLVNMFIIWPVLKPHVVFESDSIAEDVETVFSDEIIVDDKEDK